MSSGESRRSRPATLGGKRHGPQQAAGGAARRRGVWILFPALLLATLAAYQPAWHGGMLWDDDSHITRGDLRSAEGLWRIWFELDTTQQYYPVVHSAFWIFHRLWGDDTLGYHLINILLHALSSFLVLAILRRLAVPGAFLAAVIFALHPVHVESVAWISELKNTLSGSLYLGALLLYLRFDERRDKRLYALAMALFVPALLSKTVTATLPAALLVIFWWRRGRLSGRLDVLPLAPFFALGTAAGLLTVWVERTMIGAQGAEYQYTLIERCLIAGRANWFYLGKLFWPADLLFVYPRWQISQASWWQYLYPAGAVALLAGFWLLRRRSRGPLAAMLLFYGTLFPALGFFNVYPFRFSFVADHFQYLASIPVIALCCSGLARLASKWNLDPKAGMAAALALAVILGESTWNQSRQYADAETLYRTTLSRNPSSWLALVNLGKLELRDRPEEAEAHFEEALRLKPDLPEAHINLGLLRLRSDPAGAEAHFREALRLKPVSAEAHNNLGHLLTVSGRFEEAMTHLNEAMRLQKDYPDAGCNLGRALRGMGRLEEAVAQYRDSLELAPDSGEIHNDLGLALQQLGRQEEAAAQFRQALRLMPASAEAAYNLGNILTGTGRYGEAIAQYREAIRLRPDFAQAHNNLGVALQGMGRFSEAAAQYREAVRLKPDFAEAQANLARIGDRLRK